jgi:TonB-dependent receptor
MNGSGDSVEIRRSWLPDDRRYFKTLPGMQIGYARAFFNRRLGVEFNASYNGLYSQQDNNMAQYTYPSPDAQAAGSAAPTLTSIGWRDGQQITHRLAGNLSVDYKLTDHLVLSLRGSYSRYESEFFNYYTYLRSRAGDVSSDPGYTSVTAIVNGTYSRLDNENSHRHTYRPNWVAAPSLVYKNGPLTLALRGGHSNSRSESRDGEKGFFRRADSRLTRIGWTASRPDSSSPEWVITQTAGADWSVPENWGARDDYLNNVRSEPTKAESSLYSGNFDATYAKRLLGLPFLFKAGLAARSTDYAYAARSDRYTYVGETGLQKNTVIPYTKNYASSYDLDGREGNVNSLGWRTNNTNALWDIFQARPDWFVPDTVGNFTRALTYPRALDERVDAAYFELNTKVQRLRLNAGARYERTSTDVDTLYVRSEQEVADAGYDPATVEGVLYRYHDGRRFRRDNKYDDLFLSGGAKYDITQNLQAQLSASQSILRPDYDNLAGIMVFEDEERRVWVPNQNLKPERITKYFASLQRQLTPAGLLGVSAYRMDIRDRQTKRVQISREQAELQTGIDLSGNDSDTQYLSATNAAGQRSIYGLTLEYNQQLTFLPGTFKGLGLFGSFTRTLWHGMRDDTERIGYMPKSANGGIRYRYGRLNLLVRATWQDGRLMGITEPVNGASTYLDDHAYMKERTMIDVSGGFRINKHLSFVFSVRNILNAPQIQYSNTPGRMMSYAVYSSFWNCGVKGTF